MEQYYISQAQQSPTTQSSPAQFSYADPAFVIACVTIVLTGCLGFLFLRVNNKLTLIDNYKKDLDTRERELNNQQVNLVVERENLDLKKSIFNIETQVTNLTRTVQTISENMATKSDLSELKTEMEQGFEQVNKRIDKLIKGTKDEGKV